MRARLNSGDGPVTNTGLRTSQTSKKKKKNWTKEKKSIK